MVPLGSVCSEDDDVDENYVPMSAATSEPPVAPRSVRITTRKIKISFLKIRLSNCHLHDEAVLAPVSLRSHFVKSHFLLIGCPLLCSTQVDELAKSDTFT